MAEGLLARFAPSQPAGRLSSRLAAPVGATHNIDPRYKAAARSTEADILRRLGRSFTPQNVAQLGLEMLPGSGDYAAARDSAQAGQEMVDSFKGGDYGGAASKGLLSLAAGLGALPMIPHVGMMFAGKGAKTADLVKLRKAEDLEKTGVHADDIWRETGWGRGADGEWRFEIDDSGAQVRTTRLSEIMCPMRHYMTRIRRQVRSGMAPTSAWTITQPGRTGREMSKSAHELVATRRA